MRLVVLALALAASSVWGQEPPPEPAPLRLQLRLDGWLGGAQGDLQTPKGGQPGTTSSERPTVCEVGLGGWTFVRFEF